MNKEEAITILDALAAGCSPFTGELLADHPMLNDRKVIRALQMALDALASVTTTKTQPKEAVAPEYKTLVAALEIMKEAGISPSYSKVTRFFLGSRHFKNSKLLQSNLFGSFKYTFSYETLKPIVLKFFEENRELLAANRPAERSKPWDTIVYFQQPKFCKLSDKAINQLKDKITALGIVKQPPILSDYIINARIVFPRAYEPWSEQELEYLTKAILYTNDLQVLSSCFQRGERSLESVGKRFIYEGKAKIA